jgi:hypothetical protein
VGYLVQFSCGDWHSAQAKSTTHIPCLQQLPAISPPRHPTFSRLRIRHHLPPHAHHPPDDPKEPGETQKTHQWPLAYQPRCALLSAPPSPHAQELVRHRFASLASSASSASILPSPLAPVTARSSFGLSSHFLDWHRRRIFSWQTLASKVSNLSGAAPYHGAENISCG